MSFRIDAKCCDLRANEPGQGIVHCFVICAASCQTTSIALKHPASKLNKNTPFATVGFFYIRFIGYINVTARAEIN